MPQIASYLQVRANRKQREVPTGLAWRTNFLCAPDGVKEGPMAFLVEGTPARVIRPHFHENDQFQVVVSGGGVLGKHKLHVHAVHFSRAHTPYGPIVFGEAGLGFLTLRSRWDPGAQYLPDSREKLSAVPARNPWQITEAPVFGHSADVNLHTFTGIKDDRGLAAYSISMKPHAETTARFHLAERSYGRFARVIRLSGAVNTGQARAVARAGQLRVIMPRIEERRGR